MSHDSRVRSIARRRVSLEAERLEQRSLLSGSSSGGHVTRSSAIEDVTIRVPSAYVSQQASNLEVTLVRTTGSGGRHVRGPLTVDFSAMLGAPQGGIASALVAPGRQFTPVNLSVTFPAGQTTTNVVVPIQETPSPGLVPILLSVSSPSSSVAGSDATVYLASSPLDVPPSITSAHLFARGSNARGIAITFSKPMSPASVENIHNYSVVYNETKKFSIADLTAFGLLGALSNPRRIISLRAAKYDPATNTVTLVSNASLKTSGSYEISSPSSLLSHRAHAKKAQPLSDLQGKVINPTGAVGGVFSISISRGHPYVATQPLSTAGI
jgi:hypothetical protein